MCETLPPPIAWWLPAGSVQRPSSCGETTDQAHATIPSGSEYPGPVQNGVPQRDVQFHSDASFSALSIVKMRREPSNAIISSSSTEIDFTRPAKHGGTASSCQLRSPPTRSCA